MRKTIPKSEKRVHFLSASLLSGLLRRQSFVRLWNRKNRFKSTAFLTIERGISRAEMKSEYPDYPKSGFIRTIWLTENRCPKSGYLNSEKIPIFRAFFVWFLHFLHGRAYTSSKNFYFFIFVLFICCQSCQKWRKNIVEECSENYEEHNDENNENDDENDENYDLI